MRKTAASVDTRLITIVVWTQQFDLMQAPTMVTIPVRKNKIPHQIPEYVYTAPCNMSDISKPNTRPLQGRMRHPSSAAIHLLYMWLSSTDDSMTYICPCDVEDVISPIYSEEVVRDCMLFSYNSLFCNYIVESYEAQVYLSSCIAVYSLITLQSTSMYLFRYSSLALHS